jgi:hypothetical protein
MRVDSCQPSQDKAMEPIDVTQQRDDLVGKLPGRDRVNVLVGGCIYS